MGWSITKKDNKYRIYSSIVDEYITDYMNKDEIIRFLFHNKFENLIQDMIKDMNHFPVGWFDKETGKRYIENEKYDKIHQLTKSQDKMYEFFLKELKKSGVTLSVQDVDGVYYSTEDIE